MKKRTKYKIKSAKDHFMSVAGGFITGATTNDYLGRLSGLDTTSLEAVQMTLSQGTPAEVAGTVAVLGTSLAVFIGAADFCKKRLFYTPSVPSNG